MNTDDYITSFLYNNIAPKIDNEIVEQMNKSFLDDYDFSIMVGNICKDVE